MVKGMGLFYMRIKWNWPEKPLAPGKTGNSTPAFTGRRPRWRSWRLWLALLVTLLIAVWALLPAVRVYSLIANRNHRSAPTTPQDLPVQEVHFQATDGVHLA